MCFACEGAKPQPQYCIKIEHPWVQTFYLVLGLWSGGIVLAHFHTPTLYWMNVFLLLTPSQSKRRKYISLKRSAGNHSGLDDGQIAHLIRVRLKKLGWLWLSCVFLPFTVSTLAAQNRESRIARFPESQAWNRQKFRSEKQKNKSNRNEVGNSIQNHHPNRILLMLKATLESHDSESLDSRFRIADSMPLRSPQRMSKHVRRRHMTLKLAGPQLDA